MFLLLKCVYAQRLVQITRPMRDSCCDLQGFQLRKSKFTGPQLRLGWKVQGSCRTHAVFMEKIAQCPPAYADPDFGGSSRT